MKPININEPFYSAGRKYGWEGSPIGIGIASPYFNGEGDIRITIGGKPQIYSIPKSEALALVRQYKSKFRAKTTLLGVVQLSKFTKVDMENCPECQFELVNGHALNCSKHD